MRLTIQNHPSPRPHEGAIRPPQRSASANGHSPSERFAVEGLTYDDVLLVPAYSEVLPREVDTRSYFSRNIRLNVPIVSAAMDGLRVAQAVATGT